MKAHQKTNSGYSLTEVLLVLVILSSIAVGSTTLLKDQLIAQNTFRFKEGTENLTKGIRNYLNSNEACLNTLAGVDLSIAGDQVIPSIQDDLDNLVFNTAGDYENRTVRLVSIVAKPHVANTATRGTLVVQIEFDPLNQVFGSSRLRRTVQIFTERDAGNNLISCRSKLNAEEGPWKTISTTQMSTVNNIGIGTATPMAALDIKNGKLRGELDCQKRYGTWELRWSEAFCPADEWAIGGGGECESPQVLGAAGGFIHASYPLDGLVGWRLDCFVADNFPVVPDLTLGRAYAVCCKK